MRYHLHNKGLWFTGYYTSGYFTVDRLGCTLIPQGIIYLGSHRSVLRKITTSAMQASLPAQKDAMRYSTLQEGRVVHLVGVNYTTCATKVPEVSW